MWAQRPLRVAAAHLLALLLLASVGTPELQEELISVHPFALVIKGFATADECRQITDLIQKCHTKEWAECQEIRSKLHAGHKNTVSGMPERPRRNSTSFQLTLPGEIDGIVDTIVRRAHVVARHPITAGEGVQIASYHPGDYYEFHHDSLFRRATLLLYLNDVPEGDGGETIFPLVRAAGVPANNTPPLPPAVTGRERESLGFKITSMEPMTPYCQSDYYLKVRPEAGKALLFFSYSPDYTIDHYAIHGACPMVRGEKMTLQRWMRFEPNSLMETSGEEIRQARGLWQNDRLMKPAIVEDPPDSSTTTTAFRLSAGSRTAKERALRLSDGEETLPEL